MLAIVGSEPGLLVAGEPQLGPHRSGWHAAAVVQAAKGESGHTAVGIFGYQHETRDLQRSKLKLDMRAALTWLANVEPPTGSLVTKSKDPPGGRKKNGAVGC